MKLFRRSNNRVRASDEERRGKRTALPAVDTPDSTIGASVERADAPAPDDPRKPTTPRQIRKPSWKYVLRRTLREFQVDEVTDLAAALTYYAVLAVAPALIAFLSLLALVGQNQGAVDGMLEIAGDLAPAEAMGTVEALIDRIVSNQAAGLGLVLGLAIALWSASGYVGAFGRAMNRIYEIDEGRPIWKLRPTMLLVTLVALVLMALVAIGLVVSGPLAEAIGNAIGLGSVAITVWQVAKWPVVIGVVVVIVAILYYATPNVQQPKFRWISVGAASAIAIWALASLGFGFYVANFSSYDATYGSLAGIVIFLLWLWITNLALLLGAELDAELERGRQLQAGIEAEETLQLPPRDTTASRKRVEKAARDVEAGRELREEAEARAEEAEARAEDAGRGEDATATPSRGR
jgi:membrane protein